MHDFTPAEILLGYNLVTSRHQETAPGRDRLLESEGINPADVLGIDHGAVEEHVFRRDDRGVLAGVQRIKDQVGMVKRRAKKDGRG